jgi:hypothetical protein
MSKPLSAPLTSPETMTRDLPMQRRELMIAPGSWNPETRTVDVTWTTGARRRMFDWYRWDYVDEELSLEAGHIRLDRINNGAPVLNTHMSYELEDMIGVVVAGTARIEGGIGIATLQLSRREDVAGIVQDIADGIIRNISVGYMVHEYQVTERPGEVPLMRAVDWEPAEISFVPIPADWAATVRSADPAQAGLSCNPCLIRRNGPAATMENPMKEDAPAVAPASAIIDTLPAPAARAATVSVARLLARLDQVGLTAEARAEIIELHDATPLTERDLNAEIGARFAQRDTAPVQRQQVQVQRDETDTRRAGMIEAITHRLSNGRSELTDLGRGYRGLSLVEMARDELTARGIAARHLAPAQIAERALGMHTSDLPNIFANVLNKRLRMQYEENQPSYQMWAKRAPNLRDFKPAAVVQMANLPDLLPVGETGEIKFGAVTDGRINYSLTTFARQISLSRQMIINDDLSAFDRMAVGFANAARRVENRTVYGILTGTNTFAGAPLFVAAAPQANQAASGAAIAALTLGAARSAMRVQRGLAGEELNIAPRFLIVPTAQEQLAYQFTSSQFVPATPGAVNEFRAGGRTALEPIVDSVLDGVSTTAWFLAADASQCDTIEYAYLDGFEGVQVSSEVKSGVDGVVFTGLLDFAAAAIDYRGLFRNPGA